MSNKNRKIIHIDMDAFFASVEQIQNKKYMNKPVIIGGKNGYGIVTTASYEARKFGVHSTMSVAQALRICPQAIVLPPNKKLYTHYSKIIKNIFLKYTNLVEQTSIDEAYLDVTNNNLNIPSAVALAKIIKDDIYKSTSLTCSCGVSFNKFLAKIASDIKKPAGIYTITPKNANAFLNNLSIYKFHGIGKKTATKMISLGIYTGGDLKQIPLDTLNKNFLSRGQYFYNIIHLLDNSPVIPNRPLHSISREKTFNTLINSNKIFCNIILDIFEEVYDILISKRTIYPKTITIKFKTEIFKLHTKSKSLNFHTTNKKILLSFTKEILKEIEITQNLRLVGIGFSNFSENDETHLYTKKKQLHLF